MAVERIKEFTIDLGDIVKTRLDSFVNIRKRVHATEEANFQRSVVDNDLTYQEQLDYKQAQLSIEKGKIYLDVNFIDELETSVSSLKKMVRQRKFRDNYFTFLTDLVSGKKAIEDHIVYLRNSLDDETLDREIKDELKNEYLKAVESKRTRDREIVDSQIAFYKKDRTAQSIDKAMDLVKSQLTKPEVQKDEAIRTSYEMQSRTLEKEKMEVGVEDKMVWTAVQLVSQDRKNPSLWKLETFGGFVSGAGTDMPVNIGGTRYASEKEYWQVTMNDYILNSFATEYVQEIKGEATLAWNKMGLLPDTYINNLISTNQIIKNQPELQNYQQVITSAVQDAITSTLTFKAKDLTAKYYLDKPDIATESDYQKAKQELENLKILFGADYSLSPDIQAVETLLVQKKVQTTKDILSTAAEYAEAEGISLEEAIKKYGPTAAVEISAETFKTKTPMEAAEQITKEGAQMPGLYEQKTELETKIAETQKQIEEAKAKKVVPTPAPAPAPTPVPSLTQITIPSGSTLSGLAKQYGTTIANLMKLNPQITDPDKIYAGQKLTISSVVTPTPTPTSKTPTDYQTYFQQQKALGKTPEQTSRDWATQQQELHPEKYSAPAPIFSPEVYAKEKGYTKYFQKKNQWYANVAGVWKTATDKETARQMAGLK